MTRIPVAKTFRFVATFGVIVIATTLFLKGAGTPRATVVRRVWPETPASQLIFFAVLEGLYRDGVSNDDVDLITPPTKSGKAQFNPEHFVYACPLCHPAYEAFRLYRQREPFFGLKAPVDTFGPGLDRTIVSHLRSHDANERRQAIEGLISRWVGQRLEMMRLSEVERKEITSQIEAGRKQGMGGLKQAPGQVSQTRTNCPICDGSFGACKLAH